MFPLPDWLEEVLGSFDKDLFLLYAAMYEEVEWAAIRHSNDLHATVTEDDVKKDAFVSAVVSMAAAAAEQLSHSVAIVKVLGSDKSTSSAWMHRGEAYGSRRAARDVIRHAYLTLGKHGLIEGHSKIWELIQIDEKTPEWFRDLLPENVGNSSHW